MSSHKRAANLWAPWRMEYILGDKETECIFCTKAEEKDDRNNLILYRGEHNFIIMNKYPYNNGHLMIVPYRHISEFEALNEAESREVMNLLFKAIRALKAAIHPEGFNVGVNVGKIAGAGIDQHLHFHVVPRWTADTNFMPVVGQTKVISEGLWETWGKIKEKL